MTESDHRPRPRPGDPAAGPDRGEDAGGAGAGDPGAARERLSSPDDRACGGAGRMSASRCEQSGDPLQFHRCSSKWCSPFRTWSDLDYRKRQGTDEPFVREVLTRFPVTEIVASREERDSHVEKPPFRPGDSILNKPSGRPGSAPGLIRRPATCLGLACRRARRRSPISSCRRSQPTTSTAGGCAI